MPSKKIEFCTAVLYAFLFTNSVKSEEVVTLRTCCGLNLQDGSTKCSEFTANGGHENLAMPASLMSSNKTTDFQLSSEKLTCSGGKDDPTKYSKNIQRSSSTITFYPSGYLLVSENPNVGQFYHMTQYCINGITDSEVELTTCRRHCTQEEPCIKKCCPPDLVYSRVNRDDPERCKDAGPIKWTPKLFKTSNIKLNQHELEKIRPWYSLNQPRAWSSNCYKSNFVMFHPYDEAVSNILESNGAIRYRLRSDGKFLIWNKLARQWKVVDLMDNYCIDGILYKEDQSYSNKDEETFLMACPTESKPESDDSSLFYGIVVIITCPFALATFVVYGLLWEKQNVHGYTIMSLSASVFAFFVSIGTVYLTKNDLDSRGTFGCAFLATIVHYFFLSTFSWLALISFDLWVTFRFIKMSKGRGIKKFLGYSALGWGIPLFIVCLSWTMEVIYKDDVYSEVVVPMYGVRMCYLTSYAYGEYIYAPCGILMAINLIFFAMTTWNLYKFKYFSMTTKQMDCQSYVLFVKLFLVVGVLWIFEIISWVVDRSESKWYWKILDVLNCLSPVALFLIFVCKYDVLNALGGKYPVMKPICRPIMRILAKCEGKQTEDTEGSIVLNLSPIAEQPNSAQQTKDTPEVATGQ